MNSLLRQSTDFERLRAARKEKRATFLNVPFQLECLKRLYDELNPPPPMDVNTDHGHHRSSISNSSRSVRSKLRLLKATLRRQHPNYRPPPGAMPVLLLFDRSGGRYFLFMQLPRDLPDGFPTLLYDNAAGDLAAYSGAIYSQVVEAIQAEETIQEMTREEGGIGAQNNNTAAVESHTTESHTAESHTAENRTDPDSVEKREKEADKEKENEEDGAGNLRNTPAIDGDHQTEPQLNIKEEEEDEESAKENVNNSSSSVLQQQVAVDAVKEEEKAENQNAANSEKPESAEQAEEKLTTTPADDDDNHHHNHQLSPLQMFVKGLRSSQHNSNDQHSNDNNNSNKDSSRSSSSSSKRSHHLPLVTVETTANGERIRISRKRPSISNSQAFPQFQTSSHSRGKLPKRSSAGSAAVAGGDHKITTNKDENNSSAAELVCPLCEHSSFLGQADLQEHLRLLHLILGPGRADSEGEVLEPL